MTDNNQPDANNQTRLPELELLLAGQRPLVMFVDTFPSSNVLPEDIFAPHVASGEIIQRDEIIPGCDGMMGMRYLYYGRPGTENAINDLHGINAAILTENRQPSRDENMKIGRLLGFGDSEIEDLLAWWDRQQTLGEE